MVDETYPSEADITSDGTSVPQDMKSMLDSVTTREQVIKDRWLDKTKDTYEIYEGGRPDSTPFNILYSNTEVLVPNLFSTAPKPVVRRRYGELRADGPAQAAERMAEYCMDTNLAGYPEFVDAVESAVLDSALPGQGQCRVRVVEQRAVLDYVPYDKFIWGFARRWEDTPWIAFRHDKTMKDAQREFAIPEDVAAQVGKSAASGETSATSDKGPDTMAIYEVWNKVDRKVYFLCEHFPLCLVNLPVEDPLKLSGFFPSGKPLRLLSTPITTMPRSLYGLYKRQAEELNAVSERIKRVTSAIRVRGIYDGTLPEMAQMFDSGQLENGLVPATNPGTMMRDGGLDKHIWLVPVEKLVQVLQTLYQIRDQVKSTIYEILGIGDILRGVSQASETASAQQIKDKWGSLRIKRARERVATFVRANIRMMIEVSAEHTPEEMWAKVTGLPFMDSMQAQVLQMSGQPLPPDTQSWSQVLGILRDDLLRSYMIDIETNSTVDTDATQDKADVAEFMNAFGQAMAGLQPLAASGPEGFAVAQHILLDICKRFRMGNDVTALIGKLKPSEKGPTEQQQEAAKQLEQAKSDVEGKQKALDSQQSALKAQWDQQQQQVAQISEQLKNEQMNLEKARLELDKQKFEIQRMASELELKVREARLVVGEASAQATAKHAQQKVGIQSATLQLKAAATPKPTPTRPQ